MRFKRFLFVICWLGFALLVVAAFPYVVKALVASNEVYGVLKSIKGISGWLTFYGAAILITGLIWLYNCRGEKPAVLLKTNLLSVGLSATCAISFYGWLNCVCMGMDHLSTYPYEFPFYRTMTLLGFCAFAGLGIYYYICRSRKWSAKGLFMDIVVAFILIAPFFAALAMADALARKIFL